MDNKTLCDGIERIASETLRYSEGDLVLGKLMALQDVLELMVPLFAGNDQESLKGTLVTIGTAINGYQSKELGRE